MAACDVLVWDFLLPVDEFNFIVHRWTKTDADVVKRRHFSGPCLFPDCGMVGELYYDGGLNTPPDGKYRVDMIGDIKHVVASNEGESLDDELFFDSIYLCLGIHRESVAPPDWVLAGVPRCWASVCKLFTLMGLQFTEIEACRVRYHTVAGKHIRDGPGALIGMLAADIGIKRAGLTGVQPMIPLQYEPDFGEHRFTLYHGMPMHAVDGGYSGAVEYYGDLLKPEELEEYSDSAEDDSDSDSGEEDDDEIDYVDALMRVRHMLAQLDVEIGQQDDSGLVHQNAVVPDEGG
jgi:hypothetical protein